MEDIDNKSDHEIEEHEHDPEYDMFLSEVVQEDHELLFFDTFMKETFGA